MKDAEANLDEERANRLRDESISSVSEVREMLRETHNDWLVVWNIFLFFHILGIIIPTDFHIQGGRSTTNWIIINHH